MGKFKRLISGFLAGLSLVSMVPVNAETYREEPRTTETTESADSNNSMWDKAGSFLKNLFLPQVFAAEENIAEGTSGGVTWVIDSEGTLTLSPTNGVSGVMEGIVWRYDVPWYNQKRRIKKAIAKPGVSLDVWAEYLFEDCENLTDIDLNNLNTSNTKSMANMFNGCENLTSLEGIASWNVGSVTDMSNLFFSDSYAGMRLTNVEALRNWNTSNVTNMRGMFYKCTNLTSLEGLEKWSVSNVTNMSNMFYGCKSLTSLTPLKHWQTAKVIEMTEMFYNCNSITSLNGLEKWDTSSLTTISFSNSFSSPDYNVAYGMFSYCSQIKSLQPLSEWKVDKTSSFAAMFRGCSNLMSLDGLENWKTDNVNNMELMFSGCTNISSLSPLSNWKTEKVQNMSAMFNSCQKITTLSGLENWETTSLDRIYAIYDGPNVKNQPGLFSNCISLINVTSLQNWDFKNVNDMSHMFYNCTNLSNFNRRSGKMECK